MYQKLRAAVVLLLIPAWIFSCTTSGSADELHRIFESYWEFELDQDPLQASGHGIREANSKLPDASLEAIEFRNQTYREFAGKLDAVNYDRLDEDNRINYRLFRQILNDRIEAFETGHHDFPLNGWWDYHATFAEQPNRMPFRNVQDYENYINRLKAFPQYNRQHLSRLEAAVEQGRVRPRVVLDAYIPTVSNLIQPAEESRFFEPLKSFPSAVGEADKKDLRDRAIAAISDSVMPAYQKLSDFLTDVYYEAAPESPAISEVPGGQEYYEYLVRHFTTLDITPAEVHETGLAEVERIRAEMDEVIEETGFEGDFDAFVNYLRTDPRFYSDDAESHLEFTALILKRMDGKLPEYFGRLPRMPYGLREVPDYLAPRMTTAYYNRPAQDGTRAGFYYVNTYNLESRPRYEVEALSFHEAVPGHHLQLALQQELDGLPDFRRNSSFTVFVEGWALYSEWLALEMGFYTDPYSNFGRLSYEMWRALRLVVDTGIHAKGWSREQAVEYMAKHSALTLHNIETEVNRYIFWPGQALAYKTGEIKIRELRRQAEAELADRFDIRAFHDAVLENGSITLEILEEHLLAWIENQNESER